MRLDLDCVRDILLCVEENTGLRKICRFYDLDLSDSAAFLGEELHVSEYQKELLKKYPCDKLMYHVLYSIDADLLYRVDSSDGICTVISDLTPAGHSFLNNVRENSVWNSVKSVSSKIGAKSLEAVTQIASNVITELIKAQFHLL